MVSSFINSQLYIKTTISFCIVSINSNYWYISVKNNKESSAWYHAQTFLTFAEDNVQFPGTLWSV